MANRQYRRRNNGQFASRGDSGAKVTTGRAGGFANAAHRANVANTRTANARSAALRAARATSLKAGAKKIAIKAAGTGIAYGASRIAASAIAKRSGSNPAVTPEAAARAGVSMRQYKKIYKATQAAANATRSNTSW